MKYTIITTVIIAVILGLVTFFYKDQISGALFPADMFGDVATDTNKDKQSQTKPETDKATTTAPVVDKTKTVIGSSAGGLPITAYHYGEGAKEILFVGGIHGGYEWNTALVAYEAMDYLQKNPSVIPSGVKVTIVPALNPDGLKLTVGKEGIFTAGDAPADEAATVPGRFNANKVDLNRNFDCDWKAEGMWKTTPVSGGTAAFSEPESAAIKTYVEAHNPVAAVVWYSSAGGVFASNCHDGVLPETTALATLYGKASGYKVYKEFNFYEITGDMVNWFAKKKIPAISVLLTDHKNTEWSKNQLGIDALLASYATSTAE